MVFRDLLSTTGPFHLSVSGFEPANQLWRGVRQHQLRNKRLNSVAFAPERFESLVSRSARSHIRSFADSMDG